MLLQVENKCIDHDPDLVLVCSHDLANMDAKEQADRMAAAEALYMISTRGSKGRGAVTLPRKSKRGRKAKKPKTDFEEGDDSKSNEGKALNNEDGGDGFINKKRHRGREGETAVTKFTESTTHLVSKGRGRGGTRGHEEKSALRFPIVDKRKIELTDRIDELDDKAELWLRVVESESIHSTAGNIEVKSRSGRGNGKRGRSRGGRGQKTNSTSSNSPVSFIRPPLKTKTGRQVRRKSPGWESSLESSSVSVEDKKTIDNVQSKPPPKKLSRFREKSVRRSNSNEATSEDDTKTEIQALGFTGVAVTLVKTLPSKGGKAVVSQRKLSLSSDGGNKVVQGSGTAANINSTGSTASINLSSPPSLPSFTTEVANLPSLPLGIESLQLPSIPMPNLSSLSGLKDIKSKELHTEETQAQKESEKAQKVLPLKKRKLHNQKEKEEKIIEDGSDIESEEAYGDQGVNSPSTPSQPQIQTKFTVQAHPIITMQTLMEINTALTPDEDGDLPLHIAVVHENMRMVTKLINLMKIAVKGVDKFNKQQQTPLHLAVKLNFLPAVALLISSGASVNTVDSTGSSAVHMAVQGRFFKCLEHMLRTCPDAEVNARNFEGLSPLHLAVDNKDLEQVQLLLKHGADIDLADGKSGRTALFHAAETNQKPMVELLLKQGANPDLPNYAGVTTTMAAQGRSLHSILKLIGSVTQEIKWSFVTVKSNPESQMESDKPSDKPPTPSVEVYSGKSLLHSELLKPSSSPHSEANGERSKVYQSMLLVKRADEEKMKQNATVKVLHKPQSRSLAEVKKEVDSHKGDEVKTSGPETLTAHMPSLYRVKQEVVDSPEVTSSSSNSSSQGGSHGISHKTVGNKDIPFSLDRNVTHLIAGISRQSSIDGKHSPTQLTHLHPRQNTSDKRISSPSASPSSPRALTPSTPDSVIFTSTQARLYKKLLDMYNIKTCISQMNSNTPGLKSLPIFPTQLSPASPASACQATAASASVSSQPASPHRTNGSPTIPYQRSLSNHNESEQQTYVLRRNPVQRISVLPTPRDTLITRSDSPAFHGQNLAGRMSLHGSSMDVSQETDPDVPLNLSSKMSLKEALSPSASSYTTASVYHTFPKSDQMTSLPIQRWSLGVPSAAQKISGTSASENSSPSMMGLTHQLQFSNSDHGVSGDGSKSFSSSMAASQNKEALKKISVSTHTGSGLIVTDLPHIAKSVSPQTASLVRTFLAHQPTHSDVPSLKLPASSSFSILSPSVSSPHVSYPSPKELTALNIPQRTSVSSLPIKSSIATLEADQQYITVTANAPRMRPLCGPILDGPGGRTLSDPQFLHQGRIIDLSQSEESLEASKLAHLCNPPAGKIVGFSGAILSMSPPSRNGSQEDRRHDKVAEKDMPATKVTKKRGRKSGKYSQNLPDSSEVTANKINNETDQRLKKFLGLKKVDPVFLNNDRPSGAPETPESLRTGTEKSEVNNSSVIETLGIFSGNIQQVKVGKSQSPSLSNKTFLSKPLPHSGNSKPFPYTGVASGCDSSSPHVTSKSNQSNLPHSDYSEDPTEPKRRQDLCVTSTSENEPSVESDSLVSETAKSKEEALIKSGQSPSRDSDIAHNLKINHPLEVPEITRSDQSENLKVSVLSLSTNSSPNSGRAFCLNQSGSESPLIRLQEDGGGEKERVREDSDSVMTDSHHEKCGKKIKAGNEHDPVSDCSQDSDPNDGRTDSQDSPRPPGDSLLQTDEPVKRVSENLSPGPSDLSISDTGPSELDTGDIDTEEKECIHNIEERTERADNQTDDEHHNLVIDLGAKSGD